MKGWFEEEIISIRERAYLHLKNMILEGDYKAGDRLVERELAEKMKISRTPIREALFRLESQGFVKTVPRKGVVVSKISTEDVIEVFTILSSLEVLAAKLAAQKMDDQMKKEFDKWIEKIESVLNGEKTDISQLHVEISHVLYKAAKSPKLYEMLTDLMDYIRAFANTGHKLEGRMEESMKEHLDVLKAVRNQEVEMAEYLTKIHIENSKKAYVDAIKGNKQQVN
ncbi:GntR family transcriptional regulator [Desertibacillus haloalkaliphilus]|uniref:GntR family transcriptional regulator n=1 Tax=Desertibacillus haloalkaliphilus TaxID=1328930 RepID=UPI001C26C071|nr:GntR family transcriptional regulator [Desertibacillus haloalkaliphilus]MBU8908243.1 GntR family transcriptional regulator [Desertibacillus haloalkaliphilus]